MALASWRDIAFDPCAARKPALRRNSWLEGAACDVVCCFSSIYAVCKSTKDLELNQDFNTSTSVLPIRAGEGDTLIPADSIAAILDSASPFPPEMIAPA